MTAYINKEWIFGDFMCHFENLLIFVRDSFIYIFEFIGLFFDYKNISQVIYSGILSNINSNDHR